MYRAAPKGTREVREVELPEVTVLCTEKSAQAPDKITCTVEVSALGSLPCLVNLVVDTGSSVSILPNRIYQRQFNNIPLT